MWVYQILINKTKVLVLLLILSKFNAAFGCDFVITFLKKYGLSLSWMNNASHYLCTGTSIYYSQIIYLKGEVKINKKVWTVSKYGYEKRKTYLKIYSNAISRVTEAKRILINDVIVNQGQDLMHSIIQLKVAKIVLEI